MIFITKTQLPTPTAPPPPGVGVKEKLTVRTMSLFNDFNQELNHSHARLFFRFVLLMYAAYSIVIVLLFYPASFDLVFEFNILFA